MTRSSNLYRGRWVLVTGHTGFKGSWLNAWLNQMKAAVAGSSAKHPPTHQQLSGYRKAAALAGCSWAE